MSNRHTVRHSKMRDSGLCHSCGQPREDLTQSRCNKCKDERKTNSESNLDKNCFINPEDYIDIF